MVQKDIGVADPTRATMRGTNQTGVRAHNERLVLSILRRDGPLAKAEIARLTGLSAQTVSVIMRALEEDGMLLREAPRRGRVGQPSVPMRLDPDAAFFHGISVGRRWIEHVLVDMTGNIRACDRKVYDWPDFDGVLDGVLASVDTLEGMLDPDQRRRVQGLGLAMPAHMFNWENEPDAAPGQLAAWRERDFVAELDERCRYKVQVISDSAAGGAAELVFGARGQVPDTFLHVFIGYFVGGGLVIDNHLFTGPTGHAGAIGGIPIAQPDGSTRLLYELASLYGLGERIFHAGKELEQVLTLPLDWSIYEDEVEDWLKDVVPALSQAVVAAASLIDVRVVQIDGHIPAALRSRLVREVAQHVATASFAGVERPEIREGTVGPAARSMGAASLPLAARFLV